ncbi:MAG: LysR family transcriptional regulator [Gammaproteobacteria bacterium]
MNLLQLKYFVAIVEEGSFTRASQRLYVAQPSLSQHVKNLEQELSAELLRRTARGIEPTEEGAELLHHARAILEQLDTARAAVRNASEEASGDVVVGVPPTVSERITVPLILRMRERTPKVAPRIVEGMSGYVLNWLQEGRVDIGVLYGVQQSSGIETTEICREDLYLISLSDGDNDTTEVTFNEVASKQLILPGVHSGLRSLLESVAQKQQIDLEVGIEVDALSQMRALVAAGVGYTVLPEWAVSEEIERGTLAAHRIVEPEVQRTLSIAHSSDRPLLNAQRAAMGVLNELLSAQP